MIRTGANKSTGGENCPSATLSTTNPRCTGPGSKACLCGETPATNRLIQTKTLRRHDVVEE